MILRRTLIAWLWLSAAGIAAEVSVRNNATVDHAVVRLGDVADLYDVPEAERAVLLDLELLPSPAAGGVTKLGVREIQDTLSRRAPEWARCTFTGANEVAISRRTTPKEAKRQPVRVKSISQNAADRAQDQFEQAIVAYVHERLGDKAWSAAANLSEAQLVTLAGGKSYKVTGGRYLDAEHVQFRIEVGDVGASETWLIECSVTRPPMVVVARHTLGRGDLVTEYDVELAPADDKAPTSTHKAITTLEEVVGKQTTRPIAEGETILEPSVRETLMVQRGQVVTVYSRCGGVQIRTTGRAKENGGHGDLIPVESIGERALFHARVSGHQEVEILAGAPTAPAVEDKPREPTPYLASRRAGARTEPAVTNPIRTPKSR